MHLLRCFIVTGFAPALVAPVLVSQGDILHYTFDATDSTRVLDFAGGNPPGTTHWPPQQFYTQGAQGRGALAASGYMGLSGNYVNTSWTAGHNGALTIAFFLRNQLANTSSLYSPVAGQPSWSIATGGSAGAGLQLRGVTANPLSGGFGAAICTMTGWNHFAVVVDPAAQAATWYHNGAVAASTPFSGGVAIAPQAELLVGTDYVTPCGGLYDLDEFRIARRAAGPAEIAAWAAQAGAALAPIAAATGATTLGVGQLPQLGTTVTATVAAPSGQLFAFVAGTSFASFASRELPVALGDLLPGAGLAPWHVAIEAVVVGLLGGGTGELQLAFPGHPSLAGFELYAQAAVLDGSTVSSSNALALRLGH